MISGLQLRVGSADLSDVFLKPGCSCFALGFVRFRVGSLRLPSRLVSLVVSPLLLLEELVGFGFRASRLLVRTGRLVAGQVALPHRLAIGPKDAPETCRPHQSHYKQ
jgi:hypothetical protein